MLSSHVRVISEDSQRSSLRSSRSSEDGVKETEARNGFNAGVGIGSLILQVEPMHICIVRSRIMARYAMHVLGY